MFRRTAAQLCQLGAIQMDCTGWQCGKQHGLPQVQIPRLAWKYTEHVQGPKRSWKAGEKGLRAMTPCQIFSLSFMHMFSIKNKNNQLQNSGEAIFDWIRETWSRTVLEKFFWKKHSTYKLVGQRVMVALNCLCGQSLSHGTELAYHLLFSTFV